MVTRKALANEIAFIREIKGLVEVYEEVAAEKMQKLRGEITKSSEFLQALSDLAYEIGGDIRQAAINPTATKDKEIVVFMSAHEGLFGDLTEKIFFEFSKYIKENKADSLIVGKQGKVLADRSNIKVDYFYDLPDDALPQEQFNEIAKYLVSYKTNKVFYASFKNIVIQEPASSNLMSEIPSGEEIDKQEAELRQTKFYYEPSTQAVSEKISNEIVVSVFQGIAIENQLAKYSSRLMSLDSALTRIDKRINNLSFSALQKKKVEENNKQMERVSRMFI